MKQEPAVGASEAADDVQDYWYSWDFSSGAGSVDGGRTGLAASSTGTSYDAQRDNLVKVETKYDN